jgi:putative oxidoreductase
MANIRYNDNRRNVTTAMAIKKGSVIMTSTRRLDWGLLLIRAVVGAVFVAHGLQKMFVFGHAGVTGMMTQLGLPFPGVNAALITAAELGGGIALINGAFTRIAAAILSFSMIVAILTVHLAHGFFAPMGVEYPLTLLVVNLALTITGAGAFSLDHYVGLRTKTEETPAVALKRAA